MTGSTLRGSRTAFHMVAVTGRRGVRIVCAVCDRAWRWLVGWWLTVEILLFDREAREIMREEDL